jgi:hypothetical protein
MRIRRRKNCGRLLAMVMLLAGGPVSTQAVVAQPSKQFHAVVCTSDATGRWALKTQGTLERAKSEAELVYRFHSNEHSFEWRFVTSRDGHTTILGPGYLMHKFEAVGSVPEPEARSQRLETTGEIREVVGSNALALLIGSRCPRARRAAQYIGLERGSG